MKFSFPVIFLLLWLLPQMSSAQSEALLDSIERHNTTLAALRQNTEAAMAGNRSELRLSDPEAEVGYLFGTPKGIPNRVNLSVTQPLDWGVLTGRKRSLARAADRVARASYAVQRQSILAEASRLLTMAVYYNRLCAELAVRTATAEELRAACEEKFAQGDLNQMELNKVRLNATVAQAALQRARAERNGVCADLQKLNGGRPIVCNDTAYADNPLPALADLLRHVEERHPSVDASKAAVAQSEEQLRVARTENWPTLNVGFAGEYIKGNNYSGLTLGMSIPLWGNSRAKLKQRRAEAVAEQLSLADVQAQLTADVRREYTDALSLFNTAALLDAQIAATANAGLLARALKEGQLSLLDYLPELSFYYEARTAQLEAERDAQLAAASLRSYLR